MSSQLVRLNKFLAERLGVSRREADRLISEGKISINGQVANLGDRVNISDGQSQQLTHIDKSDKVCYNNKIVPEKAEYIYLAFHKPVGYVCSRHAQSNTPTLYEILPKKYHQLKTVGRLDKDSSGLILLTNDGDFAFSMTHPKFRKNKVYEVELDKPLAPLHQQMISDFGVKLEDGISKFTVIKDINNSQRSGLASPSSSGRVRPARRHGRPALILGLPASGPPSKEVTQARYVVILSEGRNRQIRRTFAALGYKVTKLHRTGFGKYELGDLKPGKYVIIKP